MSSLLSSSLVGAQHPVQAQNQLQAVPVQVESDLKFLLSRLLPGNARGQAMLCNTSSGVQSDTEQVIQTYVRTKPSSVGATNCNIMHDASSGSST